MTDVFSATSSTATNSATINQAQQSLAGDQQTFLTLLTTQLKNQDPLSPLDANQFTAQLVQMTGVQQQITTNQLLNQLVAAQGGVSGSVSLIGKQVTAATAASTLQGGQATWNYNLAGSATDVSMQVVDSNGNTVWQQDEGAQSQGNQTFSWNGQNLSGVQLPDGTSYGLKVTATTSDGSTISSTVALKGVVSSVQQVSGTTVVDINGTQVPVSLITQVGS